VCFCWHQRQRCRPIVLTSTKLALRYAAHAHRTDVWQLHSNDLEQAIGWPTTRTPPAPQPADWGRSARSCDLHSQHHKDQGRGLPRDSQVVTGDAQAISRAPGRHPGAAQAVAGNSRAGVIEAARVLGAAQVAAEARDPQLTARDPCSPPVAQLGQRRPCPSLSTCPRGLCGHAPSSSTSSTTTGG
jgi:hypothetical protein